MEAHWEGWAEIPTTIAGAPLAGGVCGGRRFETMFETLRTLDSRRAMQLRHLAWVRLHPSNRVVNQEGSCIGGGGNIGDRERRLPAQEDQVLLPRCPTLFRRLRFHGCWLRRVLRGPARLQSGSSRTIASVDVRAVPQRIRHGSQVAGFGGLQQCLVQVTHVDPFGHRLARAKCHAAGVVSHQLAVPESRSHFGAPRVH
jgi:hypothetical protein